jgi:hypothetical protein
MQWSKSAQAGRALAQLLIAVSISFAQSSLSIGILPSNITLPMFTFIEVAYSTLLGRLILII